MIQLALYYNQKEGKERVKKNKKNSKKPLDKPEQKAYNKDKIKERKGKENDEDGTDY